MHGNTLKHWPPLYQVDFKTDQHKISFYSSFIDTYQDETKQMSNLKLIFISNGTHVQEINL